jgi:hypothetical protein
MESIDRSNTSWREQALNELLPIIQQFGGTPGRQAVWIERLAGETGISAGTLLRSMPGSARPARRQSPQRPADNPVSSTTARGLAADPAAQVEEGLIALLLQLLVIPSEAARALEGADLQRPEHRELLQRLLRWQNYDYDVFREELPDEVREIADALRGKSVPPPPDGKLSLAVKLHLARLRHARLQVQLARATQLLGTMASEDQAAMASNLATLTQEKLAVDAELRSLQQLVLQGGRRATAASGHDGPGLG